MCEVEEKGLRAELKIKSLESSLLQATTQLHLQENEMTSWFQDSDVDTLLLAIGTYIVLHYLASFLTLSLSGFNSITAH